MKKPDKKNKFILLSVILFSIIFSLTTYPEDINFKWRNISGEWGTGKEDNTCFLTDKQLKYIKWDYNELINYHSIVTFNPINDTDSYVFSFIASNPVNPQTELLIFFALKNYRDFYAFKYIINQEKDAQIQFINSKIKDPSLKPAVKNNYTIAALQSKNYDFEYNKRYKIEIKINKNKAELFIDGNKEIEAVAPENLDSGKIGFSNRNARLRIEDVKVFSGEKIVFEDDFSTDSIRRWKVRAKVETKD